MKKVIYNLLMGATALLATSCMEVDNFDGPDAWFSGTIIDVTTGQPLLANQGECRVRIWEKSWSLNPDNQDIPVKQDGTFNNNKLFRGTYDVVPEGAWWPADTIRVGIGNHAVQNFEVTPYLRLFDLQVEFVDDSLTVSCRIDAPIKEGLPDIEEIHPYLSINQFCGNGDRNHITWYDTPTHPVTKRPLYWRTIGASWNTIPKLEDGMSAPYVFRLPVERGYTYFVRMGANVDDTFRMFNYTEIKTIEIPNE